MRTYAATTAVRFLFAGRRKKRDGCDDRDDKNGSGCGHEMTVTTVTIVTDGMDRMGCDGTERIRTERRCPFLFFPFGAGSRGCNPFVLVQGGNACSGFRGETP